MHEIERLQHSLHAQSRAFQRKLDEATRHIDEAMKTIERPYVAFSGGIDSTCLLDLLYTQGHRIDVLFGDEGWDYPETIVFLREAAARYGFTLRLVRDLNAWRAFCEALGRPDLAETPDAAWGNPFHAWYFAWDHAHPEMMPTYHYSGVFLGLLAAESRARRITLRNGKRTLYSVTSAEGKRIAAPDGRNFEWHACPLATWTKRDAWGYIVSQEIPYNPVYDTLAALDVPLEQRRVAALSYTGVAHYGSHAVLKRGWPALFNQLAACFPEVRSLV